MCKHLKYQFSDEGQGDQTPSWLLGGWQGGSIEAELVNELLSGSNWFTELERLLLAWAARGQATLLLAWAARGQATLLLACLVLAVLALLPLIA